MSKYIVDIPDGVEWGVVTCKTEDGFYTRDFDSLEELNSNYINEHFSCLQDAEYQKGYRAGRKFSIGELVKNVEYQRGLNDAWEAARKIVCDEKLSLNTLKFIFNRSCFDEIFENFSAIEVIEKLKAYEEQIDRDVCRGCIWEGRYDGDCAMCSNNYRELYKGKEME